MKNSVRLTPDAKLENPNSAVHLISTGKMHIRGFLTEDISFGNSATYAAEAETDFLTSLNQKAGITIQTINSLILPNGMSQYQIKSAISSIQSWRSSSSLELTIPLVFIATSPKDDVRVPVIQLQRAVLPIFDGLSGTANLIEAPLGYTSGIMKSPRGVFSVNIGKWLGIPPLMLITSAVFTFSKETIITGLPLYAIGKVSMISFRIISAIDVERMLSGNSNANLAGSESSSSRYSLT